MDDPDQLPFAGAPRPGPGEATGADPAEVTDPAARVEHVTDARADAEADAPTPDPSAPERSAAHADDAGPDVAPAPALPIRSFQASSGIQGRQFAEQCDTLLAHLGFQLRGRRMLVEIGVEIDQEAVGPAGTVVWFEYKGSVQGNRPGLRRTDTMKKAIANGALLRGLPDPAPYVVITSHLPETGSGAAMLAAAQQLGYLADVVCLYDTAATARLKRW